MINYIEVSGVSLSGSPSVPQITRTPEGVAMGSAPGWAVMLDPDYIDVPIGYSAESVLNRAKGSMLTATKDATSPSIVDVGGNLLVEAFGDSYLQTAGDADINPAEWTVFMVIMKDPASSNRPRNFILHPAAESNQTSGISLAISHSTQSGNIIVYEYGNFNDGGPQRISVDAGLLDNQIKLIVVTFSVHRGLNIFVNGVLAASAPDDKRPLTQDYLAGEYAMFRFFRGRYGMSGILNSDLSAPENVGHRLSMERFLMDKYNITV